LWRTFGIPEHGFMTVGTVVASSGFLVFSSTLFGFLFGIAILGWGFHLWITSHLNLITNLRWREIRRGHARRDIWLLRFHSEQDDD
ncbi:MAG: hypothetical protein HXS50_00195, partial [Theionarchaea archaeon]|nr:hypothetical protein [Theionarchaea archaeon]